MIPHHLMNDIEMKLRPHEVICHDHFIPRSVAVGAVLELSFLRFCC